MQHQQQLRGIQLLALRTEEPPHERIDLFPQQFDLRARFAQFAAGFAEFRRRASERFAQLLFALRGLVIPSF